MKLTRSATVTTPAMPGRRPAPCIRRRTAAAVAAITVPALLAACGSSPRAGGGASAPAGGGETVAISLTPGGCVPSPARVTAGHVRFKVKNSDASAVSEAELRSGDLSHILGEQEI